MFYLKLRNRWHGKLRESKGKSAKIVDVSMQGKFIGSEGVLDSEQPHDTSIGDKAFDDITDLENEDFIFLY